MLCQWCAWLPVAVAQAAALAPQSPVASVVSSLLSEDRKVRSEACARLGGSVSSWAEAQDPQAALRDLLARLATAQADTNPDVRARAAVAFSCILTPQLPDWIPPLTRALATDPAEDVRYCAAWSIDRITARFHGARDFRQRFAAPLLKALGDASEKVRRMAMQALGHALADSQAAPPRLLKVLDDPQPSVRAQTVAALEVIGDWKAVPAIRTRLGDPDPDVRLTALQVLGQLSALEASDLPPLLIDPSPEVRAEAKKANDKIGGPYSMQRLAALRAMGNTTAAVSYGRAHLDEVCRGANSSFLLAEAALDAREGALSEKAYRCCLAQIKAHADDIHINPLDPERPPSELRWAAEDGLGEALMVELRFADAIGPLQTALATTPGPTGTDRGRTQYNLACSLARVQRFDEALPALQAAIALKPDYRTRAWSDPDLAEAVKRLEIQQLLRGLDGGTR